jgi:toxin ParE1/3/4
MTSQFRLTQPAILDIEDIADYISSQSDLEQAGRYLTSRERLS